MLGIEFSKKAQNSYKKLKPRLRTRIKSRIEKLKFNPVPNKAKRIQGTKKVFRMRIGSYRVLYELFLEKKQILYTNRS